MCDGESSRGLRRDLAGRGSLQYLSTNDYFEPFIESKVYVVWATDGVPFYPEFHGRTKFVKLEVTYSCHLDKKRDIRSAPGITGAKK